MNSVRFLGLVVLGLSFGMSACSSEVEHETVYRSYCEVNECVDKDAVDFQEEVTECIIDMDETIRKIPNCAESYVKILECYPHLTCTESTAFDAAEEACDKQFEQDDAGYIGCVKATEGMKLLDTKCSQSATTFWDCLAKHHASMADDIF